MSGNPKITVICTYSPTSEATEEDVDVFYSELRTVMDNIPSHNFFILAGDMNAKLGPDYVNFTFNDKTNRNGEKLLEYMEEYGLFSSSNGFMKPKNQLWTFEYPSGQRAQIICYSGRNGGIVLKTQDPTPLLALWDLIIELFHQPSR